MNTNGNGHTPPFRLAPIESPEEEARGLVLKEIAPQIRRRVREDLRLSPGAKYFFNCLFDDCFWHQAGGHGTGQIYADVRDLGERYRAWPDTITRWRDELAEAGWLWTKYAWPMTEWRLTPLMPAPANSPHKKAVQMSLGRAAAKGVGEIRTSSKNGQPVVSAEEKGNSHSARTEKTVSASASSPPSVGKKPLARTEDAGESVGKIRTGEGHNPYGVTLKSVRAKGKIRTGEGQNPHGQKASSREPASISTRPIGSNAVREKTPGEGSIGDHGGVGGKIPPAPNAEMIWWEGKWWFESRLHRQLKLLDEGIASATGDGRRRLRERRHSLLVALGVAVPKTAAPAKAAAPVPGFELPPKSEWQSGIARMRAAVREATR